MSSVDNSVSYQQVRIKGIITKIVQHKKRDSDDVLFTSHITVPAPDTLSHPVTYGVNGDYPAGALDSEVDVVCSVSSYQRRTNTGIFFNYSLWLASGAAGRPMFLTIFSPFRYTPGWSACSFASVCGF